MNATATLVRTFGRALSTVRGPRLSILIFHRVLPAMDPLLPGEPDAAMFEARMSWLASAFKVLPLVEAARRLRDGSLPSNAACVTFDDGYADNEAIAAPILARLRLPATFFVSTGFLDGGRMWNDTVIESVRRARGPLLDLESLGLGTWPCGDDAARARTVSGLLNDLKYLAQSERQARVDAIAERVGLPAHSALMMTRDQLRSLRRYGMSIGAHTVTHPILKAIDDVQAAREIADGKRDLEETLQERVKVFAYPNGVPDRDYDAGHVELVRELGFDAAVSTSWGSARRTSDRFQLPRFTPWDLGIDRFGARLAQNLLRDGKLAGPAAPGALAGMRPNL